MNRASILTSAAAVLILSVAIFAWTIVHALFYAPDSEIFLPMQSISIASATSSEPVRLVIPVLHVNASVQHVGITKTGAMGTPDNFTDVGWYKYGPAPGAFGSAVIDGHVSNGLSLDGVFKHLIDIKLGDSIYVTAADGSQKHFVVVDIEIYPYRDVPSSLIFARNDATRLNLITCEGVWVAGEKTYEHRLVVYTKLVSA